MRAWLALTALLLLPACGGEDPEPADPAPPSASAGAASPTDASPSSEPSPEPSSEPSPEPSASAGALGLTPVEPAAAAQEAGVDPEGAVLAVRFFDARGDNLLVLRRPGTDDDPSLRAAQVLLEEDGPRLLREVRDGDEECEFDETADYVPEALGVEDADGDGVGEVRFAYRLACRSDVSESEQKLLVLEDGDKFILRGLSTSRFVPEQPGPEPEPRPEAWPAGAHERALAVFRSLPPEF